MRYSALCLLMLSAVSTSAIAADLPSRVSPPVFVAPLPIVLWTGPYIGGQVGYSFGKERGSYHPFGTFGGPYPFSHHIDGVIGGGHVGYLYSTQSLPFLGGALGAGGVIGLEGDVDGGDERFQQDIGILEGLAPGNLVGRVKTNIQGSIRGRAGFAVGPVLIYGTGGAAFAAFDTNYLQNGVRLDGSSHTKTGWTAGGGVEYALSPNVRARVEYRYSDFGSFYDLDHTGANGGEPFARRHEIQERVQAGLSYWFVAAPPAVVARY